MKKLAFLTLALSLAPTAAFAYVGPGAGLSLLGALWALLAAVALAIAFVVAWPIRKMLRNRRKSAKPQVGQQAAAPPETRQHGEPAPARRSHAER